MIKKFCNRCISEAVKFDKILNKINKPVVIITAPDVTTNTVECFGCKEPITITEYDYSSSHIIYNGKDLGTLKSLEKKSILAERINKTIWLVKNSEIMPERLKNEII